MSLISTLAELFLKYQISDAEQWEESETDGMQDHFHSSHVKNIISSWNDDHGNFVGLSQKMHIIKSEYKSCQINNNNIENDLLKSNKLIDKLTKSRQKYIDHNEQLQNTLIQSNSEVNEQKLKNEKLEEKIRSLEARMK
jgi:chromosome segregation ATPase